MDELTPEEVLRRYTPCHELTPDEVQQRYGLNPKQIQRLNGEGDLTPDQRDAAWLDEIEDIANDPPTPEQLQQIDDQYGHLTPDEKAALSDAYQIGIDRGALINFVLQVECIRRHGFGPPVDPWMQKQWRRLGLDVTRVGLTADRPQ